MNNGKRCNYCKWTGHMDDECRKKKADNKTSGSTERNKGKSKDKTTKANIMSTPTPQDYDSDDTDSESVNGRFGTRGVSCCEGNCEATFNRVSSRQS